LKGKHVPLNINVLIKLYDKCEELSENYDIRAVKRSPFNAEGIRFKKSPFDNEGIRYLRSGWDSDAWFRWNPFEKGWFKRNPFSSEGIRFKKNPFEKEGIRFKKSVFNDEGIRFKRSVFGDEGVRYKKNPFNEEIVQEGINFFYIFLRGFVVKILLGLGFFIRPFDIYINR
jgi:hypothetical protein